MPPKDANPKTRVCLGVFVGAHGVKGVAKVKTYTQSDHDIAAYGAVESEDGARSFTLSVVRAAKPGVVLVTAPEIAHREDAIALTGVKLFVPRDRLPEVDDEDEFYLEDLIGLEAFTDALPSTDPQNAGRVAAVHNFGAGDLIELKGVPGRKGAVLVPFTKEAVPDIDLAGGRLFIDPIYLDATDRTDGDAAERKRENERNGSPKSDPDDG